MAARSSATETSSGGDDERLLIEAAKADPQRFADLYEQNFDRVYAFVVRRSGSRGEAEDLTAEVCGEPAPESREIEGGADADRRAVLGDLVGRLPHDQQRVVVARFVEQKSIREIAQALGRTEGAVKQLQFRALETLRSRMRDIDE